MSECPHEWEQVWIEFINGTAQLVGPFRCRLCHALREESHRAEAAAPNKDAAPVGDDAT
jgi:hypothetical protein